MAEVRTHKDLIVWKFEEVNSEQGIVMNDVKTHKDLVVWQKSVIFVTDISYYLLKV
jgi:hypothetical protein